MIKIRGALAGYNIRIRKGVASSSLSLSLSISILYSVNRVKKSSVKSVYIDYTKNLFDSYRASAAHTRNLMLAKSKYTHGAQHRRYKHFVRRVQQPRLLYRPIDAKIVKYSNVNKGFFPRPFPLFKNGPLERSR